MEKYDHKAIEKKWQEEWKNQGLYNVSDSVPGKENFYELVEFTYPSGNLHVGHWYAFSVPDIHARFKRMQGFNVLYPMGFDAFGLPAENAAIKLGADPKVWTYEQMDRMRTQFYSMGAMFPWDREVVSCDPKYYKWTQWMFNQFLKNDLVYRANTKVNWCPKDKTILANEQVIDGTCDRCGSEVVQRDQEQWMIRITKYADRLVDDLEKLDWPHAIKEAQKNWIGRSEGSEITFSLHEEEMLDINTGPHEDAFREGEEIVDRDNVVIVIEHPEKDEFLCAKWKQVDWQGFVTGGIENGKTIEETVMDEVREETGYQNPTIVRVYDQSTHGLFWHVIKKQNRRAHYRIVHVKLQDLERKEPTAEEQAIAEFLWVPRNEVNEFLRREDMKYPWRVITGNDVLGTVPVFTTRADTLFGVTYVVLAPEHPMVQTLMPSIKNKEEVKKYIEETKRKSELDRQQSKEKTGVEIKGVRVKNPANGEMVPLWIADYVLAHYGTGAVMAVPAHDERDFEFAKKYDLPIKSVIDPLFIREVKKDLPLIERNAVSVIVKHWSEDKYLGLQSDEHRYGIFITGGIEVGQNAEQAAKAEIEEEVGYCNAKFIKIIGRSHSQFYHTQKKENRFAHFTSLYFELLDGQQKEISEEEKSKYDKLVWLSPDKVDNFLTTEGQLRDWRILRGKSSLYTNEGILGNSSQFDGLTSQEAKQKITEFVGGKMVKTYRLRDWGISRQRYWGCPIPIVYDPEGNAHAVPDEHLPWILPTDVDHTPDGTAPLARSQELLERTEKIFGKGWKPEVETMDTFVDSSWYFYRYLDNKNESVFADTAKMASWMPVDLYMGGAEHTTMHLLYSRFWVKALFDLGFAPADEAYKVRRNRGLILGPDGQKMSKSRGNVIDPDEIVDRLGADTVRLYLAFMGPYGVVGSYPWDPNGVVGVRRFLERVWKLGEKLTPSPRPTPSGEKGTAKLLHKTIKKISEDIEEFKFNTAISAMMIFVNEAEKQGIAKEDFLTFLKLLAPFAPHMAEELWQELDEKKSIHLSEWPKYDPKLVEDDEVTLGVQVNGKTRGSVALKKDAPEEEARKLALAVPEVEKWTSRKTIKKFIYVPGKIVNIVVEE